MTPEQITARMKASFADCIEAVQEEGHHPHVQVRPDGLIDVCRFLKDDPSLRFDLLRCISSIDWPERNCIELSYDMISTLNAHGFAVKVVLDRSHPQIGSVSAVWPSAIWHEREAYDLMGITFSGHPELCRILMPDDWTGHPLRKDYQDLTEYHGLQIKP